MIKKAMPYETIAHGQGYNPIEKWQDVFIECPDCREKSLGLGISFKQSQVSSDALLCLNCKCIFKVRIKEVEE